MPSGPGVEESGKPDSGGGNLLFRAVPGLLIVIDTNSSVVGLSQEQPPMSGSVPKDFPGTVIPRTDEMSCGETIEHASISLAALLAPEGAPGGPPCWPLRYSRGIDNLPPHSLAPRWP